MCNKIFTVVILLFISYNCLIAQNISFVYDSSGNRIERTIVLQTRGSGNENDTFYEDTLNYKNVKIYPNPTSGLLKVELTGLISDNTCIIQLYSSSGSLIKKIELNQTIATIDIKNYPNGVYILTIGINEKTATWKVVKK